MDQDETRDAGPPPPSPAAGPPAADGSAAVPEQSGEHRHKHIAGAVRVEAPETLDAAREAAPAEDGPATEALEPVEGLIETGPGPHVHDPVLALLLEQLLDAVDVLGPVVQLPEHD